MVGRVTRSALFRLPPESAVIGNGQGVYNKAHENSGRMRLSDMVNATLPLDVRTAGKLINRSIASKTEAHQRQDLRNVPGITSLWS